jgi:Ima1 N-terminal domain
VASSKSENNLFCDACLKNQHLFTSSLAQYIPDDSNPLIDRKYIKFREDLEKRYPQVCEDCAPRVLERYNRSQYTAKTDHMRRLMDRTRANGGPRKTQRSWIDILGRTLYLLGILGQVYWNLAGIYGSIRSRILDTCTSDEIVFEEPPSGIQHLYTGLVSVACRIISLEAPFFGILKSAIPFLESDGYSTLNLAKWCFWLSVISVWWNPKLKQSISGFDSHLKGLGDWYKYHVILLISRIIFRSVMDHEVLSNPSIPATLGAHTFMLGFTTFVSKSSITSTSLMGSRLQSQRPRVLRQMRAVYLLL